MCSKFKICWNYIYIVVKLWMVLACWFLVLVQTEQRILWNDCYNLIQIWIYFKNWVKYVPKLKNLEKLKNIWVYRLLLCFLLFSNQFLHYVDELLTLVYSFCLSGVNISSLLEFHYDTHCANSLTCLIWRIFQ